VPDTGPGGAILERIRVLANGAMNRPCPGVDPAVPLSRLIWAVVIHGVLAVARKQIQRGSLISLPAGPSVRRSRAGYKPRIVNI